MWKRAALWMCCFLIFLVCVVPPLAAPALAVETDVSWTPDPTSGNTVGYIIHYGTKSRFDDSFVSYDVEVDVGNVTSYVVDVPDSSKMYYFCVVSYNKFGLRSQYSQEAILTLGLSAPRRIRVISE